MSLFACLSRSRSGNEKDKWPREQMEWYRQFQLQLIVNEIQDQIQLMTWRRNYEERIQLVNTRWTSEDLNAMYRHLLTAGIDEMMKERFGREYKPPADHVEWYNFHWKITGESGNQTARLYIAFEERWKTHTHSGIPALNYEIEVIERGDRNLARHSGGQSRQPDKPEGSVGQYSGRSISTGPLTNKESNSSITDNHNPPSDRLMPTTQSMRTNSQASEEH
jgi:hypothetical protein